MSESTAEVVGYEQDGHVVTITYRRPEALNAINGAMRQGLNAAWQQFRDDQDAWVAIVTGAGRAFCAGADLKDGAGSVGTWPGTFWEIPTLNSFESGWEIFKPTIAAVNGPCIGYGLTAAAHCDFLIAAESATFAYPEVRIGVPTIVGALRLPPKLGWQHAMELLLLGDPIDAARAQEIGLAW
ncbi:MAG: enoyl-CoA hydratase/isomerase family protein, partial [Acidimicrobiales bacterium]